MCTYNLISMKANYLILSRTNNVHVFIQMGQCMKANGLIVMVSSMVMENVYIKVGTSMKANG